MSLPLLKYDDGNPVKHGELQAALSAFKSRINREGHYPTFAALRDKLKATGMKTRQAEVQASRDFRPAIMADADAQEWPLWGLRCEQPLPSVRRIQAKRALANGDEVPSIPEMGPVREKGEELAQINRLAFLVGPEKRCGAKEAIEWVASYMLISSHYITPDVVPGMLALVLLAKCRENPAFSIKILESYIDKAMPTKNQVEYEQKFLDDGREKFSMLESFVLKEELGNVEVAEANPTVASDA
jgi:hypothetical protein